MSDRRAELEAAIEEDPYDPRGYAVLADYLQELGDPRGELIALQLANRRGAMEHAAGELLAKLGEPPEGVQLGWANGYARSAIVDPATAKATRATFAHPSCRFLVELRVRGGKTPLASTVAAITEAPRPSLRVLGLGIDTSPARQLGDCSALWTALPRLVHVEIYGQPGELGTIELPRAEAFTLASSALTADHTESIAKARWPALRSLHVACGQPGPGVRRWLRVLITRDDLPELTQLALVETTRTDELLGILAASPILKRLRSLELSRGTISESGVHTLLSQQRAFAHLSTLDLRSNNLSAASIASLKVALPNADTSRQRYARTVDEVEDDDDDPDYDRDLYDF